MTNQQLQTVLDVLESLQRYDGTLTGAQVTEAITTIKQMMQAEPIAWLSIDSIGERYLCFSKPQDNDPVQALYAAPRTSAEPLYSAPKDTP